ncbi:hypothetical protein FA95DRAFT_242867 [Auriscalpium vulgare]|uniref:Uncharacterized protein n=1 Tax=Auriscalpium vulgare TaxID=40419 RepID=A0ACB8S6T8_9AGAM|nr:hypothetical protein FA95DRAFT_242867 [Auriscalpium vulgare]
MAAISSGKKRARVEEDVEREECHNVDGRGGPVFKRQRRADENETSKDFVRSAIQAYFTREEPDKELEHKERTMDADLAAQEKARALLSWHQLPSPEHDTSGASVAVQHPRWWLNDGDVIISVGRQAGEREHRVLFKLHKDVLCRHLKPFHDMLSEDSAVPEAGKLDREPVILWETENAVQWSLIATILYTPQEFGVEPVLVEDIENLLEMSVQMQCIRFREAAVSMISTIYPVTLEALHGHRFRPQVQAPRSSPFRPTDVGEEDTTAAVRGVLRPGRANS